jgi:hypothetical protein
LAKPTLAYNNINKFTDKGGTISAMLLPVYFLVVYESVVEKAEASH